MSEKVGLVEKINEVYDKLPAIEESSNLFDEENLSRLEEIATLDLSLVTEDLQKGNYLGNRKIDIDLTLNNESDTSEVYYSSAKLDLTDGTEVIIDFTTIDEEENVVTEEVSSYTSIFNKIVEGIETYNLNTADTTKRVVNSEIDIINETLDVPTLIRVRDVDGTSSNIERVTLTVYGGGSPVETNPTYYWAKTTSSLQVLGNRTAELIKLAQEIDRLIVLSTKDEELDGLYEIRAILTAIYTNSAKYVELHSNLPLIQDVNNNNANITTTAENAVVINTLVTNLAKFSEIYDNLATLLSVNEQATIATQQAQVATEQKELALQYVNQIEALTVRGVQLVSSESAYATYNSQTGEMTVGIPQGLKGDRGESFKVDVSGDLTELSNYDSTAKGFAFLALDTSEIYFKKSDTLGDWTDGVPFGKGDQGDQGDQGEQGVSITDIARTSGDGSAGTTDTYTITMSNATTYTFDVTHGANGQVQSINGMTGDVTIDKSTVGLGNVDNTSDANKPVSVAQQTVFDTKVDIANIVNNLTSTYTNRPLSAYQGKVLKDLIDNINTILTSDNSTLDSIQELVDYITQNRDTLSNLGISNIAGLGTALDNRALVGHDHDDTYLAKTGTASDSVLLGGIDSSYYRGLNRGGSNEDANTTTYEYILSKTNTPNTTYYWHIRTQFYASISASSNRAQIAIQYNNGNEVYARSYFNGTWTSWVRLSVPLSSSVASTSTTTAATSYAARTAYNKAVDIINSSVGSIGTYAFLDRKDKVITTPGTLVSGSLLEYTSCRGFAYASGTHPSGTWECMGYSSSSQDFGGTITLYKRKY